MRDFSTTVTIAATPLHVWEVLVDVERWADWTPTVRRIERLDAGPLEVGSRVRIDQPKLRPAIWTVTAWEPEVGFTWVSRSPGLVATGLHAIEASADGSRITLRVHFGGLLASVVGVLASGLTRTYLGLEAAGLKARCEKANVRPAHS
jgi:carbon monoxide dehydrogenase subunit G